MSTERLSELNQLAMLAKFYSFSASLCTLQCAYSVSLPFWLSSFLHHQCPSILHLRLYCLPCPSVPTHFHIQRLDAHLWGLICPDIYEENIYINRLFNLQMYVIVSLIAGTHYPQAMQWKYVHIWCMLPFSFSRFCSELMKIFL